jgi:Mrp family chromosome partitioning ATPase
MIEAFRQADGQQHQPPQPTSPAVEPGPAGGEVDADADPAFPEDMPFIEVGGKGRPVTASPDVLPPAAPVQAESPSAAGPVVVAFEPWPAQRPAVRAVAPELLAFHDPDHAVSRQYRTLLDHLLGSDAGGAPRALLLTAAAPGVGTTTTLLNLAITCARGRRCVAAVDLNLYRPAVAARLGLLASPGLPEVLAGTVALEQALQATAVPGLYALTAVPGGGPSAMLTADALRWVVRWLREHFDVVFLDGPPWEGGPEMTALVQACDAVYPVLRDGEASSPPVQQMLHAITRRGGKLRGLIHTQRAA